MSLKYKKRKFNHLHLMFISTLTLLVYGEISRLLSIPFFWESSHIGIIFSFISLIFLIHEKFRSNKKSLLFKSIGIILIVAILVISIVNISIFKSEPYKTVVHYFKNNIKIKNEIGEIESFGFLLSGSVENKIDISTSELVIIVKGRNEFSEHKVKLTKEIDSNWKIVRIIRLH